MAEQLLEEATQVIPLDIEKALRQLDDCDIPDDVASLMRRHGVTGRVECPYQCVIANYLLLAGAYTVGVDYDTVFYYADPDVTHHSWPVTEVVSQFLKLFDDEHYPDLEAK